MHNLRRIYLLLVSLGILTCLYSYFKPGIAVPAYPNAKVLSALAQTKDFRLASWSNKDIKKDSSDRKLSPVYFYKSVDGSELISVMVRVRKRDDFKIEAYGQLTKDLKPIYIENPIFQDIVPRSMLGQINKKNYFQTCIVPGSKSLNEIDVRLSPLTEIVEKRVSTKSTLLTKLLGSKTNPDFSCLVLTFNPNSDLESDARKTWVSIVDKIQASIHW